MTETTVADRRASAHAAARRSGYSDADHSSPVEPARADRLDPSCHWSIRPGGVRSARYRGRMLVVADPTDRWIRFWQWAVVDDERGTVAFGQWHAADRGAYSAPVRNAMLAAETAAREVADA